MLTLELLVHIHVALAQIDLVNNLRREESKLHDIVYTPKIVTMPAAWSPCLQRGRQACNVIAMPAAWSPYL